jgi:hypothetical protein
MILFIPQLASALVPIEGILLGEAQESIQSDPLKMVFRNYYNQGQVSEDRKVKFYYHNYQSGKLLGESCEYFNPIKYQTSWKEKQAQRSMAATLQYVGLDALIKAIGAYANQLEIGETEYKTLVNNLVKNYCSKNVTVFSLRNIEQALFYYYKKPATDIIPEVFKSPYVPDEVKKQVHSKQARSVEFDYAIKGFRSFCSWGVEVDDYRLLSPYLKNPFIMSFVIKNMSGQKDQFDELNQKVMTKSSDQTVRVICEDLICRATNKENFIKKFPLASGSTGLTSDLSKLYCHHFRFQDYSKNKTIPQIKEFIQQSEIEEPVFETNFFISLMTGIPDPVFSAPFYKDLTKVAKSSIQERWDLWASSVLNTLSKELLYEESLKIKLTPRRDLFGLKNEGFRFLLSVTLGEIDRIINNTDEMRISFDLKLSKNYLRSIRTKWDYLSKQIDLDGQSLLKQEIAQYLELQLKQKEKYFLQKIWNQNLATMMAEELLAQVILYPGNLFETYDEKVLSVPVEFNYGIFALSYLRYRADVNADRLKFKF